MSNSDVSKQIIFICSTVRICVLVTGQEQILTELKSSWLVILTVDLSAVILSPDLWLIFGHLEVIHPFDNYVTTTLFSTSDHFKWKGFQEKQNILLQHMRGKINTSVKAYFHIYWSK